MVENRKRASIFILHKVRHYLTGVEVPLRCGASSCQASPLITGFRAVFVFGSKHIRQS